MKSVIVKYLEKLLEEYKYSLKSFIQKEYNVEYDNLNLKHLKCLQHIEFDDCDVLQNDLMTFEQILKCREKINLRRTEFTFDQIIQLKAHCIKISAKDLTNEQIKIYLKMWENGEIDDNIVDIEIELNGLKVLDREYYIDGLLTVSENHGYFKLTRIPKPSMNYSKKCVITFWFDCGCLMIQREMNVTKEQLYSFSHAQLLEYTLKLREEIEKNGYVYPYSKSWFDLPAELREMIIDEMDSKTRCKFTECSMLCEKEAKQSRNFLYRIFHSVSYNPRGTGDPQLYIGMTNMTSDYYYKFVDVKDSQPPQTTVIYKKYDPQFYLPNRPKQQLLKWKKIENGKAEEVKHRYLQYYLNTYQNSIKNFTLNRDLENFENFNVKNLKYLNNFTIYDDKQVDFLKNGVISMNQIIYAETFCAGGTHLSFDEILNLKGDSYTVKCNEFYDVNNINKYLKMLKNGQLHQNLHFMDINWNFWRDYNRAKITKGLHIYDHQFDGDIRCYCFKFKLVDPKRENSYADVTFSQTSFYFVVYKNDE
ncbi:unnamed protein product [Caenorhabditis angaria]|uniref:F-box domain-containing protein n=1 Tax=Caenorhabditis angaria TaxID=860376 RepID=A0A9P1I7H6_9PELO|nr:unnamed protein product [Caenorhabditis angaria]